MPVRMLRWIEKEDGTRALQYKTNPQSGKWHTVPSVTEEEVREEARRVAREAFQVSVEGDPKDLLNHIATTCDIRLDALTKFFAGDDTDLSDLEIERLYAMR